MARRLKCGQNVSWPHGKEKHTRRCERMASLELAKTHHHTTSAEMATCAVAALMQFVGFKTMMFFPTLSPSSVS